MSLSTEKLKKKHSLNNLLKGYLWFFALAAILVAGGCRKKKKLKAENNLQSQAAKTTGSGTGKWVKLPSFSPEFFTTKSKIKFEDSAMSVQVGASFRSHKGEKLWGSISYALGIEVARLLIRKDSAFVWDKFNGQLLVADYPGFANSFGVPPSIEVLQEMLLLGKVSWLAEMEQMLASKGDTLQLAANSQGAEHRTWLLQNQIYSQWVKKLPGGPILQVVNQEHKIVDNQMIPHKKVIDYYTSGQATKPSVKLVIDHSKFEFPSSILEMPFDVPAGIKRTIIE